MCLLATERVTNRQFNLLECLKVFTGNLSPYNESPSHNATGRLSLNLNIYPLVFLCEQHLVRILWRMINVIRRGKRRRPYAIKTIKNTEKAIIAFDKV